MTNARAHLYMENAAKWLNVNDLHAYMPTHVYIFRNHNHNNPEHSMFSGIPTCIKLLWLPEFMTKSWYSKLHRLTDVTITECVCHLLHLKATSGVLSRNLETFPFSPGVIWQGQFVDSAMIRCLQETLKMAPLLLCSIWLLTLWTWVSLAGTSEKLLFLHPF